MQAADLISDEARTTLPVILRLEQGYVLSVGFYRADGKHLPGKPRKIRFPKFQCFASMDGKSVWHEKINYARFGIGDPTQPVGDLSKLQGMSLHDFNAISEKYYKALKNIAEHDLLSAAMNGARTGKSAAVEVNNTFSAIGEDAFESYYQYYGKQLLTWAREQARQ